MIKIGVDTTEIVQEMVSARAAAVSGGDTDPFGGNMAGIAKA